MSDEFKSCWLAALHHLDHQVEGGIKTWIKAVPSPPFLEHLSFRLGNQLFFIRVEDASGRTKGPGNSNGVDLIAAECDGHACVLPMRMNTDLSAWQPIYTGWGLIESRTGTPIDPVALLSDEPIEMTDWEIHDMAIQIVRADIEEKQYRIMSWNSNPEVDPSLWFVGANNLPEWVVVRAARYPQTQADQPENLFEIGVNCSHMGKRGYFASVVLASSDDAFAYPDVPRTPLWRGNAMLVKYEGLQTCYSTSEE